MFSCSHLALFLFTYRMPRKCVGTLSGEPCCFGSQKQPAIPSAGDRCSFCKPREELESLSKTSWSAIARVAATLTSDQQALFLSRLSHVPNLKNMVETAIVKKCGQVPVVKSSEKTPTHKIHDSVPSKHQRMSVLDQGKFGLCSEFALATCAAHSLQCKYGLFLSDETLLRQMAQQFHSSEGHVAWWMCRLYWWVSAPVAYCHPFNLTHFASCWELESISVKWFMRSPAFAVRW